MSEFEKWLDTMPDNHPVLGRAMRDNTRTMGIFCAVFEAGQRAEREVCAVIAEEGFDADHVAMAIRSQTENYGDDEEDEYRDGFHAGQKFEREACVSLVRDLALQAESTGGNPARLQRAARHIRKRKNG